MDPFSAFSLAGTIIQVVDFGLRILSKGNQIYHSGDGVLSENQDLEIVANDFLVLCTKLQCSSPPRPSQAEEDQALQQLSRTANELAAKLLQRLNMAKAQGRFRRWKSFRQALKSVWSKRDVDDMARRLETLRSAVNSRILISLRYAAWQATLLSLLTYDGREKVHEVSIEQASFRDWLRRSPKVSSAHAAHEISCNWPQSFKNVEVLSTGTAQGSHVPDLHQFLSPSSMIPSVQIIGVTRQEHHPFYDMAPFPGLRLASVEKAILRSFEFPHMSYRYEAIASAHARTFEWIFRDSNTDKISWDNFLEWLQHGSHVYWITGKAASGKSTLMKYIIGHPQWWKSLKVWAGNTKIICANFFFWHLGSHMQRSQTGLLRSLLHQIFSQCGDLIPRYLPELWERAVSYPHLYSYHPVSTGDDESDVDENIYDTGSISGTRSIDNAKSTHNQKRMHHSENPIFVDEYLDTLQRDWPPWSLEQLGKVFEEVIKQEAIPLKFCFFVDGLDEFDGDHGEIAALFHRTAALPNMKICLSSRPLVVFEQEFESYPRLRVHELTKNDIRFYAHERLSSHRRVVELSKIQPGLLSQLTSEVTKMSSGVFLWVTLAIRSLLSGLTNQDDITDLQRRLYELPPELDDLFSKMLLSVKPEFYRGQAARLLQMVYQSASTVSALAMSFADEIYENPSQWITPKPVDVLEAARRVQAMSARLQSRTAGLLEVSWDGNTG